MKRKALIVLASVALLWGLLFALQFTLVGYILIGTCGMEYYRTLNYWRDKTEKEGDLPPSFSLQFGGDTSKQGTIVPCLLLYSIDDYVNMLVDFSVPRDWTGAQYLDLTRLELVLQDGRTENLLPPSLPVRFYFGKHKDARRFYEYSGGQLKGTIQESAMQGQAFFYSTLWPPTEKATLIAEGTIHLEVRKEDQPFKQVSNWTIARGKGLRKVSLP